MIGGTGQAILTHARRGQIDDALQAYRAALPSLGNPLSLTLELSVILRQQQAYTAAIEILTSLPADAASDGAVKRELGHSLAGAGDNLAATRAYDAALERVNFSSVKRSDVDGLIDLYQGAAEAARECGNPVRSAFLYSSLADVLAGQGMRDRATEVRELSVKNARASAERRVQREALQREESHLALQEDPEHHEEIAALMDRARNYLAAGHLTAATEECHDVIRLSSDYLPVHFLLAEVYRRRGRFDLAAAKATALLEVFTLRNDNRGAAEACRILAEIRPADVALRRRRIELLTAEGLRAEAAKECWWLYSHASAAAPQSERLALLREIELLAGESAELDEAYGDLAFAQGRRTDAVLRYMQAADAYRGRRAFQRLEPMLVRLIDAFPDDTTVRERLADCLFDQGKLEAAIAHLVSLADQLRQAGRRAESIEPLLRVAQTYEAMDMVQNTIETYDLLLRLAPDNPNVRQHFINFSLARGRSDIAARTLRALADFLLRRSNYQQAVASLTQLISLQPDDAWGYDTLAVLLAQQGATAQATMVYERYLQRQPADKAMSEKLQALRLVP